MLHYSLRTEEAYLYWCKAFIRFHGLRHPAEMGGLGVMASGSVASGSDTVFQVKPRHRNSRVKRHP